MNTQEKEVQFFFNDIAVDYKSKYSATDAFLNYFFNERLIEATNGFDFSGKMILDIGAGTGNLYDYLVSLESTIDFYASDIASNMLENSNIPVSHRFTGFCYEIDFPVNEFDYIFMLGVTTYQDDDELEKTLDFIHSSLKDNGKAIITFTNQTSIDWKTRKLFKLLAKGFASKKYVLSQEFKIYPKKVAEVEKQIRNQFKIEDIRWLNHTIFPFSQLIKTQSVKTAQKIHGWVKSRLLLKLLSSDFLIVLTKK